MADTWQRTEKATPRRLQRARRQGNFPSSRQFLSAVQFLAFVTLVAAFGSAWLTRTARLMRALLVRAFQGDLTPAALVALMRTVILPELIPLALAGAALMALAIFTQLAITRMGLSSARLMPDVKRLSLLARMKSLPGQNVPAFLQALLLLPVVGLVVYYEVAGNLDSFLALPWMSVPTAVTQVAGRLQALLWRAAGLVLVVGGADLAWQHYRYAKQLRMSKQEVREEIKEQQGNPHVKMRIRRLQRDLARRPMIKR